MAEKQTAVRDCPLYDFTESIIKASLIVCTQDKSRIQLAVSVSPLVYLLLRIVSDQKD